MISHPVNNFNLAVLKFFILLFNRYLLLNISTQYITNTGGLL